MLSLPARPLITLDRAEVPADLLGQAERGAANCPEEAITVGAGTDSNG